MIAYHDVLVCKISWMYFICFASHVNDSFTHVWMQDVFVHLYNWYAKFHCFFPCLENHVSDSLYPCMCAGFNDVFGGRMSMTGPLLIALSLLLLLLSFRQFLLARKRNSNNRSSMQVSITNCVTTVMMHIMIHMK